MLKMFGFLFFVTNLAWATSEPQKLFVVSQGKVQEINFSTLQKVDLVTINQHPNFISQRKIKYSGYLVKDILKTIKLKPNQPITIVGKTGQFSIEVTADELMTGNNIIATHSNGETVQTEGNGLQIIYDEKTLKKYPQLKQRQFWCWWVRTFIVDQEFKPTLKIAKSSSQNYKTPLPWPVPYGISSRGSIPSLNERKGVLLTNFKKLNIELLNGSTKEITPDPKSKFFLAEPVNNKTGAYSLHQIIEKDGKIETIISNLYYLKSVESIQ